MRNGFIKCAAFTERLAEQGIYKARVPRLNRHNGLSRRRVLLVTERGYCHQECRDAGILEDARHPDEVAPIGLRQALEGRLGSDGCARLLQGCLEKADMLRFVIHDLSECVFDRLWCDR